MSEMKLVIGPKSTSTWSFRAWLLMKQFDIPFVECSEVPEDEIVAHATLELVPSGRIPILIDDTAIVWEALAIIEYLVDRFPNRGIWPESVPARAEARSIASELYNGFHALKRYAPMVLGADRQASGMGPGVAEDIQRVVEIWNSLRERYCEDGMFLFGSFTAVDAMFAPIIARFDAYGYPIEGDARRYMDRILTLPNFERWLAAAGEEVHRAQAIPA